MITRKYSSLNARDRPKAATLRPQKNLVLGPNNGSAHVYLSLFAYCCIPSISL